MTLRITDLKAGDQIHGWLRIGRALKKGRNPDGSTFRYTPTTPHSADVNDIQKFVGQVVSNSPSSLTITVNVAKMDIRYGMVDEESLPARITYTDLQRIRLVGPAAPKEGPLSRPYRITTEVALRW